MKTLLCLLGRFSFVGLLVAAFVCVGCNNSDDDKPNAKWTIGMSQCNLGEPWRVEMNAKMKAAADQHEEIRVVFKDAQNDVSKQKAQFDEFISDEVDLIIVSPKEAAPLVKNIEAAMKAGIPVIVLDRGVNTKKYTCFISADHKKIGQAAGEWIVKKLGGKGKVVELKGLMTSIPGQERHSGFRKGLEGSDVEVIADYDMQWLEPNARKEMESALARFDDIDLVYSHNDPGAHGAYLAAKAAGREKDIIFVGIDALPHEGQAYVKNGILAASFLNPTGGDVAIETALKILRGETVEKKITLNSKLYTKDGVEDLK